MKNVIAAGIVIVVLSLFFAANAAEAKTPPPFEDGRSNTNTNANTNVNANTNNNVNANSNVNANTQGQQQGQIQGQGQLQGQGQVQGNVNKVSVGGTTVTTGDTSASVSLVNEGDKLPASTATAPGLQAANGTCMGSTSGGAQGASFGISVGSTWVDEGCDARFDANALVAVGDTAGAIERLCMKAEIREARKAAGNPCAADKMAAKSATAAPAQVQHTDPFVRRRLGLAPL